MVLPSTRARAEQAGGGHQDGFTGQEHDADLGLINMKGRIYDPVLGQFLSPDPYMPDPMGHGLNGFAYVENQPLDFVDPSGFVEEIGAPGNGHEYDFGDDPLYGTRPASGGAPGLMGTEATAKSFQQGSISLAQGLGTFIGIGLQIVEMVTMKPNPEKSTGIPQSRTPQSAGSGTNSAPPANQLQPTKLEPGRTALQMPERMPNDCTANPGLCLAEGPSGGEGAPGSVDDNTGGTGSRTDIPAPAIDDCEPGQSDCIGNGAGLVGSALLPYALPKVPVSGLSLEETNAAKGASEAADPTIEARELTGIQANKVVGDAAADELAESLRQTGLTVEREVPYQTPFGTRMADLRVSGPEGVRGLVEVKVGSSSYTLAQRAKDLFIERWYAHVTSLVRY